MENAKKFFEETIKTEEAKALFDATEKPANEDELAALYVEIAKKLGVELTVDEINAYFETTNNVAGGEIDDEELAQLVGGADKGNDNCKKSYKDKQNCWWNDACDNRWTKYSGYLCKNHNQGANLFASVFTSVVNAKDSAENFVKDHNLDS